jgi:uncharacterized membrane protein YhfC
MDVFFRSLNALLMIALPLALGAFIAHRWRASWRLYAIGVVTFVGAQIFHLPFNAAVLSAAIERISLMLPHGHMPLWLLALLYGLSAGLFEEVARYLVYRLWLRDVRTWRQALMFGAGHGGIEAILLGGLATVALIQAIAYRGSDLSTLVPPENLEAAIAQLEAYWALPWYAAVLGAVERVFALCFHLCAAILVLQSFTRRSLIWLVLAIGWHTLVNAVAVFTMGMWGAYAAEGVSGLAALLSFGVILAFKGRVEAQQTLPQEPSPEPGLALAALTENEDISQERLNNSRYVQH